MKQLALVSNNTIVTSKKKVSANLIEDKSIAFIKKGIWIYFFLLIFEGALRKWVLPSLSNQLLIIRDPVAVWLIFKAWQKNLIPSTPYLTTILAIGVLSIITAIVFGHGNIIVALYGARPFLLHYPLMFIMGRVLSSKDVIQFGRATLYITIPMTILVVLQFYSPQTAWVNRGVGGDMEGAGFSGAMGYMRPPGTFSFTNGNALFYGFAAVFIVYFWLGSEKINKLVLIAATGGLLAAIPISISRGLFFQVAVSFLFALMVTIRKPKYAGRIFIALIGILIVFIILSQASFFNTAIEAFTSRFTAASNTEGGLEGTLGNRYFGGMIKAFKKSFEQPFWGLGTGMGTNVGSMLLSGDVAFLVSEEEWGRLLGELGPLMGLTVIIIRLALSVKLALAGYRKLETGDLLPWMLLSFGLTNIPQSGWAQPTPLGFFTLIGGLLLASFSRSNTTVKRKMPLKSMALRKQSL